MYRSIILLCTIFVAACTSVTVKPVDSSAGILHVCIQVNPQVKVQDFVPVLQDGFDRHGIGTEIISGRRPHRCEYALTYTALRSWGMSAYLSHVELSLQKGNDQVAYAEYYIKGNGRFSLTKWAGTKSKVDPLIDRLLGT